MCVQEPCIYLLSAASVVIRNNNSFVDLSTCRSIEPSPYMYIHLSMCLCVLNLCIRITSAFFAFKYVILFVPVSFFYSVKEPHFVINRNSRKSVKIALIDLSFSLHIKSLSSSRNSISLINVILIRTWVTDLLCYSLTWSKLQLWWLIFRAAHGRDPDYGWSGWLPVLRTSRIQIASGSIMIQIAVWETWSG